MLGIYVNGSYAAICIEMHYCKISLSIHFSKEKRKNRKKRKKKAFLTGGARRFVKVFDILFDSLKYKYDYQKKWQNP